MPIETHPNQRLKILRRARVQFLESVANPLKAAIHHRSPISSAQIVWQIPVEAAANGFTVEMCQDKHAWVVTITKEIDGEMTLRTAGEARSLLKALFQLVTATEIEISRLEAECRIQIVQSEADTIPAA